MRVIKATDLPFYISAINGAVHVSWVCESELEHAQDFSVCSVEHQKRWADYVTDSTGLPVELVEVQLPCNKI